MKPTSQSEVDESVVVSPMVVVLVGSPEVSSVVVVVEDNVLVEVVASVGTSSSLEVDESVVV